MKKQPFYPTIFAMLVISFYTKAQIHDFDSLANANPEFARISEAVGDTLDIFESDEILRVTLESDFKTLVKKKYKEEYQKAVMRVMFSDTVQVVRNIKIRARGVVRKSTCMIPPIKLNLPKKKAFIKQFASFDKLKMVLDCKRGASFEQYLLLEYYAYKIQNIINDYSLRVRLMLVDYIDYSGKFKDITRHAFIIESIDQLAERHDAMRVNLKHIRDQRTNLATLADAYLFQFLIGNTDWSIPGNHNVYFLKSKDPLKPVPHVIPYDFDYAGIVNTSYAVPDERLGIDNVRERVYRGICINQTELLSARARFLEKKREIYRLLDSDVLLSNSSKRSMINYVDEFFKILESDNQFKRHILDSCRG